MDQDGDFVIAWESFGQDASNFIGVFAQRYNASGTPQGSEFQVNTFTFNHQMHPSIDMEDDGDFIIVWDSASQDGSFDGIYAQRYQADGMSQGSEFRVNTYTTGSQSNPNVGIDSDSNFIITWQSFQQDGSGGGVYAQQYRANGLAEGGEFQVNTYTTNTQQFSNIAMNPKGNFVITWEDGDFFIDGQDGARTGVYAQRYSSVNLSLDKNSSAQSAEPGDIITYTIKIENSGIATATNTIISRYAPPRPQIYWTNTACSFWDNFTPSYFAYVSFRPHYYSRKDNHFDLPCQY